MTSREELLELVPRSLRPRRRPAGYDLAAGILADWQRDQAPRTRGLLDWLAEQGVDEVEAWTMWAELQARADRGEP